MTLVTPYLPDFVPVNDAERIAGLASSNTNSIATDGDALFRFRGTTMGQSISYATPTGATAAPVGSGLASSAAANASLYVAIVIPGENGEYPQGRDGIAPTTGSGWQQVDTVASGNQTAF